MPRDLCLAIAAVLLASAAPGAAQSSAQSEGLKRASTALARGDGIAAEAELRRLLDQRTPRELVAARMGEALIQQGDRRKAREWLAPGKFVKADAVYGWRMLGLLERLDGNLGAAGQAYDQALKLNPKDSQLWVDIGRMRYLGGEQVQAILAAEDAVKFGPDNVRALEFRAQLLRDQFGLEAALPWFEAGLARAPDDIDLLAGYAATLGELGRAGEMLGVVRRLLELSPGHPMGSYLQAVLAARAGETDLARSILIKAKAKLDKVPAAQLLRGALELEAGNAVFARELLFALVQRQPANRPAQLLLARALYEEGNYRELFERFGTVATRADTPAYLLTLLARALEDQGKRDLAAPLLDRAALLGGLPHVAVSDHAAAQPATSDAYAQAGDIALLDGAPAMAAQRYMAAASIRFPDSLLLRIAEANERSGRAAINPGMTFAYLGANPQSRMGARLGAGYAGQAKDWDRAVVLLESLVPRGAARDARVLSDLALAQLRGGERVAALASARAAYRTQRSAPSACLTYALALIANRENLALAADLLAKAKVIGADARLLDEARQQLALAKR